VQALALSLENRTRAQHFIAQVYTLKLTSFIDDAALKTLSAALTAKKDYLAKCLPKHLTAERVIKVARCPPLKLPPPQLRSRHPLPPNNP
jgi:hypothetical protein